MSLIPLQLPPGIYRNGTDFEGSNRWRDANLIRWHDGSMRPIGGWTSRATTGATISGVCRGMVGWVDNSDNSNLAIGTNTNLYYVSESGVATDITPTGFTTGSSNATVNTGYGGNFYGTANYGQTRPSSGVYQEVTTWSLDNWGEYLIAMTPDDGKLYEWQLNTSNVASAITNAPVDNRAMVVTEERFIFALGAGGNPRKVQWCDRENNTDWTPSATNEAGDFELQTTGAIMCGVRMRGRTLIVTDNDAHIATYQGPPFVYGFERVGTACGSASRKSLVAIDEGAFWMGRREFYMFDGSVAKEVPCDVSDYVFDDINEDQITKVYAVHNSQFGEIWWFYPSANSNENDRYVVFDYKEGHWEIGTLERTAGIDNGVFRNPIWIDSSNDIYNHETGYTHSGSTVFAESGPISLGNGDNIMRVNKLIPDERTQGQVQAKFKTRFYPNDTETTHGAYTLTNPTSVRFSGRQIRIRLEGTGNDNWRAGVMRVEARPGGTR